MPESHHHLWQKAAAFAAHHHRHHERKDGITPYIAHPFRVAFTLRHVFGIDDDTAICTAILHDTIEDTMADYDDLLREFNREIAFAVACLSKDQRKEEEEREQLFYDQIEQGPWQARAVKLADAYDNICDAEDDTMRAKAIEKGKRALEVAGTESHLEKALAALKELIASKDGSAEPRTGV